jgi:hypothetical protein
MIIDHIRHAKQFHVLGIGVRVGLQFLARPNLITLEKGRYDLPDRPYLNLDQGYTASFSAGA